MSDSAREAFIYDLDDCLIHYKHNRLTQASSYLIERFVDGSISSLPGYLRDKYSQGQTHEIDGGVSAIEENPEDSYVLTSRPYLVKFAREETKETTSELGFPEENVIMFPGISLDGDIFLKSTVRKLVEKRVSGNFMDYLRSAFRGFSKYKEEVLDKIEEEKEYERLIFFDNSQSTLDSLLNDEKLSVFKCVNDLAPEERKLH